MRITIDSADNCEMYSVTVSCLTDEEGYTETTVIVFACVNPNDMVEPAPKPNQKKPEIKHANVHPFTRR